MTHLACAESAGDDETHEQMVRFDEATALLVSRGVRPAVRHAANSAALLRAQARLEAVRPGLAVFGVSPRAGDRVLTRDLRPVMRVRTEVVAVRDVEAGAPVGYGATWRAPRRSRIATLPMGYADGLSRRLSGTSDGAGAGQPGGHVLVRGKRAPIVGAVSMDMTMIDVTEVDGASPRDEVVVLGEQDGPLGRDVVDAQEIATRIDTIPWEVLTSVSRRVPRFYREP
jgi:alanine racemase